MPSRNVIKVYAPFSYYHIYNRGVANGNNYEDITIARLAGFKKIYCLLDPDSIGMDKMKSDKVHFIKNLTEIISYE